jgi:hypothetical protein
MLQGTEANRPRQDRGDQSKGLQDGREARRGARRPCAWRGRPVSGCLSAFERPSGSERQFRLAAAISRVTDEGVHTTVHRETITDPAKVQEIEAALRNQQTASALADVVTGEHPQLGFVVLVKTGEGTVLLKDGALSSAPLR